MHMNHKQFLLGTTGKLTGSLVSIHHDSTTNHVIHKSSRSPPIVDVQTDQPGLIILLLEMPRRFKDNQQSATSNLGLSFTLSQPV